ncbi:hypothetical protein RKLH11_1687 [Rhodobacteraceae bacterium KLH11]|nr:hypothetical protein RKLH11_1687 [Rhodobacteraceae bacterium KLH11]
MEITKLRGNSQNFSSKREMEFPSIHGTVKLLFKLLTKFNFFATSRSLFREEFYALPSRVDAICNGNVTGFPATGFKLDHRYRNHCRVGANLREVWLDGQVSAGITNGNNHWLSPRIGLCTVQRPCDSTLPASHKHLLFRTPSFRRQARVPRMILSAVFFLPGARRSWRKTAQFPGMRPVLLHNNVQNRHLRSKATRNQKGQNSCRAHELSLHWQPARAWRPVAIPLVNRPCWGVAQGRWGRRSSMPTRCSAQPLGPRATCFTARRRTTVTDTEFPGAVDAPTVFAHYAAAGLTPRGGVSRFQTIKTKDVPCSTRS